MRRVLVLSLLLGCGVFAACTPQQTASHFGVSTGQVTPAMQHDAWAYYQLTVDQIRHENPWLVCIRTIESDRDDANHNGLHDGGYGSDGNGYFGAYQFLPGTWDSAANATGRPWLAGHLPTQATDFEQDAVTLDYARMTNGSPWAGDLAKCGRP